MRPGILISLALGYVSFVFADVPNFPCRDFRTHNCFSGSDAFADQRCQVCDFTLMQEIKYHYGQLPILDDRGPRLDAILSIDILLNVTAAAHCAIDRGYFARDVYTVNKYNLL
ncbi:MAG: hypothetical protein HYV97_16730 [Bdellovibrio sp.]|nr:hypothetical protein [Bdellovibrio sp.]